ncbi:hypothetical protein EKI51_04520 [Corynebacterium sanguinis]|nr:hypothetical protein EKI50_04650 [Corynebacterium sanguinis]TVS24897.1 hypothetical protein EKI51_04520 [Corynebacterium sanguinis]TVS25719.1 hypothetical protein EKI56_07890 [Corynebacterium sanguinis]
MFQLPGYGDLVYPRAARLNIDFDFATFISVLLQSWARVEKPNLKTLVVLAPGCLSCLEYPADDHRVWVRLPVGKHRALAFP